jgi:hypothetical protein
MTCIKIKSELWIVAIEIAKSAASIDFSEPSIATNILENICLLLILVAALVGVALVGVALVGVDIHA